MYVHDSRQLIRHCRLCLIMLTVSILASCLPTPLSAETTVVIDTPMTPPYWALLERRLLDANAEACEEFYGRFFDERGYLLCVERWGGNDGPDDAIENCNDWSLLHILGCDDRVLTLFQQALEGHIRQYTLAKTTEVPLARDGMYYKEFPVMFDWVHLGEGLNGFNLLGLCTPNDSRLRQRIKRFAGFYMNEDPGAPNYDPEHRIIRSMFNGSRGPLLRKATALDWAGDPIEVKNRFEALHGERNYEEMLAHFKDYNDIVGDHPQNLCATSLALNAYAITGEKKYRDWLLEYVDAWAERTRANANIIPTNIGLDGTIGGATEGKWYGGVYGWSFSVIVPQTGEIANRNTHQLGLSGFGNAFLLTGDPKYPAVWRDMIEAINRHQRTENGVTTYPTMYGDDGWYAYRPGRYSHGVLPIYFWSMSNADRERVGENSWLAFLEGRNPDYAVSALSNDLNSIRERIAKMREDTTTPDTRLADATMRYNPAAANTLVQLMLGGLHPGRYGGPLHARLRYFDPIRRRSGIPEDVAALVTRMTADEIDVTFVNLNLTESRELIVQSGAYGEHQCRQVSSSNATQLVDAPRFSVVLKPGCGNSLTLQQDRYRNPPQLRQPWDHGHP